MTTSPTPSANAGPGSSPALDQSKIDNYCSERGARAYYQDHRQKLHRRWSDRRERALLRSYLAQCGEPEKILDLPSGYGRFFELLAEYAPQVVEADLSPTMLELNAKLHDNRAAQYLECSALAIPCADRAHDTTVSIRINHHLNEQTDRERHIREVCRVSRRFVILTFFSADSLKNRLRRMRSVWSRKRAKNVLSPERVRAVFADCGFEVLAMRPLSRIGSGHIYAFARRSGESHSNG